MAPEEIYAAFIPHFSKFVNLALLDKKPLLAHYTSLDSIEKIFRSQELWFSNPLFMNDLQEVRFGLDEGRNIFRHEINMGDFSEKFGAERTLIFSNSFGACYDHFDKDEALNLFVFCLSEHDPTDNDGLLSMWRGYGGNGGGVAMVINMDFLKAREESPFVMGKVEYASDFSRRQWIRTTIRETKEILLANEIEDTLIPHVSAHLFLVLKIHALLTKHKGFSEEREWRVIYLPERDPNGMLSKGFSYVVGKSGVQPKLKFPLKPLPLENPEDWTFEGIVDRIILGPSLSNYIDTRAVRGMFEALGQQALAKKVVASGIPFRAT